MRLRSQGLRAALHKQKRVKTTVYMYSVDVDDGVDVDDAQ